MARKLERTTAEERILSMALLSGLTGRDLQRLGGQLERNRKLLAKQQTIDQDCQGWQFDNHRLGIEIRSPSGNVYVLQVTSDASKQHRILLLDDQGIPKQRAEFHSGYWWDYEYPKRLYPMKSRVVYAAVLELQNQQRLLWKPMRAAKKPAVSA